MEQGRFGYDGLKMLGRNGKIIEDYVLVLDIKLFINKMKFFTGDKCA